MDVHLGIGRAVGGPADHAHLHRRHPAQQLYTPAVPQAYLDILELRSNVWFGELIRNIHHWSANLLIVVAVLHLIRVFATGAPPVTA